MHPIYSFNTPPFSSPGCHGRYRGKVWRTTKANFLFLKTRGRRGNVSTFTFNSLLHCYCIKTKQDCCDRRKSDTVLQFDRTVSKILYAVDHVFHLLCAFNYLQPTKKFIFSAESRSHWFVTNYAEWLWGREWIFPGSLVSQVNWGMAGSKDTFVANWKLRGGIFS